MDGSPVYFAVSTPGDDCEAHQAYASTLELPEADTNARALHVIANGPSARGYTFPPDTATLALNGALGLFTAHNKAPTYWAACDSQALVADLLPKRLPTQTKYLVASRCHESVFTRLRDRDVRLWHIGDPPGPRIIPTAISVTLSSLILMCRLGYRVFDIWGWDCCFDGEEHHATPSVLPTTPERHRIEVLTPGEPSEWYDSNPSWCVEFEAAKNVLPHLEQWCGAEFRIHGKSLVSAILPRYAAPCG